MQLHIEEHDHVPIERGTVVIGAHSLILTKCAYKYCGVVGAEMDSAARKADESWWDEVVGITQGLLSLYVQRAIMHDPTAVQMGDSDEVRR